VEVMEEALVSRPWSWIYFVSFVLIGTFVVLNLFIAVVVNNLEASKAAELEALATPVTHDEILRELERTRAALTQLQQKLAAFPEVERPNRS
jgi:voltage-gated sodium channel